VNLPGVRDRFRAFPLDDALLFFQPSSGTSVRVQNERTRGLRRRAPRVAMFGITNRCNLTCDFCSRDTSRESVWTVESAARVLQGLAAAGTLEVAFGGGEPFSFRGFRELLSELHHTTSLAMHVTTNGTLLDARSFAPYRGLLGQVRVSIYDDPRWLVAARALSDAGQLWGANVLVDERRLATLPALLARLAALGCHDVSLLAYVGGDPRGQLSDEGRSRLAKLSTDAPVLCRMSVCFGDRVPVPRLFDGSDGTGDCGAGLDFVSLTPDRRVQACSFQDESIPAESSEQILEVWRRRHGSLTQPASRIGCTRRLSMRASSLPRGPAVALWRAFSGNNSGECILIGKFESSAEAQRYLAELRLGWAPDGDEYSAEWRELFKRENVSLAYPRDDGEPSGRSPSSLVAIGRSVLAVSYDADDAFPELRALTWKRAGYVVAGGIHEHDSPTLLACIRCRDAEDARRVQAGEADFGGTLHLHGDLVFACAPTATRDAGENVLKDLGQRLERLAEGRPLGAELVLGAWDEEAFLEAKKRLAVDLPTMPRLLAVFYVGDAAADAKRFAGALTEADARVFRRAVLVEGLARRKRAAVLALRQNAAVVALDGRNVEVSGSFWFMPPPATKGKKADKRLIEAEPLARALSDRIGAAVQVDPARDWRGGAQINVATDQPQRVLAAMNAEAERLGAEVNLWVADVDKLGWVMRRLVEDANA
jgi:MoaA/NifB/PqqE/SkfB family radical SAM enzyme